MQPLENEIQEAENLDDKCGHYVHQNQQFILRLKPPRQVSTSDSRSKDVNVNLTKLNLSVFSGE